MIEIGTQAPDFTLPRDGGEMLSLSALRPKAVSVSATLAATDSSSSHAPSHSASSSAQGTCSASPSP